MNIDPPLRYVPNSLIPSYEPGSPSLNKGGPIMSKRSQCSLLVIALLTAPISVLASGGEHHPAPAPAGEHHAGQAITLKGEVLDLACYIGHGAKGPAHAGCARTCAKQGQPTGLLADDGTVYVIFGSHEDPAVLGQVKELAGKRVEVTGEVFTQSGLKGLQVAQIKAL